MQNAMVTVQLNHTSSNREPYRYARLVVSDAANHHTIVEVTLTPEEVYHLLAGVTMGPDGVPGQVIELPTLHHLGKKTNAFSRTFQRDFENPLNMLGDHVTQHPDLIAWAEAMKTALGGHSYSWAARNNGINLTIWRYENDMTRELKANIEAILYAEPAPKGLQ